MPRRVSIIIGWAGAIYGILRGLILASRSPYQHLSESISAPGQPAPPPPPPSQTVTDPVVVVVVLLVLLLIFGSALALLMIRQREAFTGYAITLVVISVLTLPSIGWVFLPATGLLLLAAIIAWLPSKS